MVNLENLENRVSNIEQKLNITPQKEVQIKQVPEEFNEGDWVIVHKPKDTSIHPGWPAVMDKYDDKPIKIIYISKSIMYPVIGDGHYNFSKFWCEKWYPKDGEYYTAIDSKGGVWLGIKKGDCKFVVEKGISSYCHMFPNKSFLTYLHDGDLIIAKHIRPATEEEIKILDAELLINGKKFNKETHSLEDVIKPPKYKEFDCLYIRTNCVLALVIVDFCSGNKIYYKFSYDLDFKTIDKGNDSFFLIDCCKFIEPACNSNIDLITEKLSEIGIEYNYEAKALSVKKVEPQFKRGDYITTNFSDGRRLIGILNSDKLNLGNEGFPIYAGLDAIDKLNIDDSFGFSRNDAARLSSPYEIALLDTKLSMAGKRFDKDKLEIVSIIDYKKPISGEMAIFWGIDKSDACCRIYKGFWRGRHFDSTGAAWGNAILFESSKQFKEFIKS